MRSDNGDPATRTIPMTTAYERSEAAASRWGRWVGGRTRWPPLIRAAVSLARLASLPRALLNHAVLIFPTGLGCLSTAVTDPEIEFFLEIVNHRLQQERR